MGIDVVDQNVIWILQGRGRLKETVPGNRPETISVDAVDNVETVDRIELHEHRRHGLYVFESPQFVPDGDWHAHAERHEHGSRGWLHHDVSPDAFSALSGFEEQAAR